MSSYGWRIEDVDNLTLPQTLDLMEQIKQYPPTNVLITELLKGLGNKDGANAQEINSKLSSLPNVKVTGNDKKKHVFTKTGNRIRKLMSKKTGRRII